MPALLFALYLVAEIAAVVVLANVVGFMWTVVILLAAFGLGLALLRSQVPRVFREVQLTLAGRRAAGGTLADSALVTFGASLVLLPGLVTTALGVLLLAPPTRAVLRPLLRGLVNRRFGGALNRPEFTRVQVIDGEVVDAHYDDGSLRRRALP